jgi:hypothetical protein
MRTLIVLAILFSLLTHNHSVLILAGLVWLCWPPMRFVAKAWLAGYFVTLGSREAGRFFDR